MFATRLIVVTLLWSLCAAAWATGTDIWRVTELPVNAPASDNGIWYQGGSALTHGLDAVGADISLYAVAVVPGLQYTLQLSVLLSSQHIRAYLYDRWPQLPGAHRIALPSGPLVVPPQARRVVYRWQIGIAARSSGSLLYLLVRCPRTADRRVRHSLRIAVYSPPLLPQRRMGEGTTYLMGPHALTLVRSAPVPSYLLQPVTADAAVNTRSSSRTPHGDLLRNGTFRFGLKNWVPQGAAADDAENTPQVGAGGLHLPAGATLHQRLDVDIAPAASLVLWADLRLLPPAHGGVAAPGLAVALCYDDRRGAAHCGNTAYRIHLYPARPGITVGARTGRSVPSGHWYHFQTDIGRIMPPPMRLDTIALTATGKEGAVQLREIHLIAGSDDDATH